MRREAKAAEGARGDLVVAAAIGGGASLPLLMAGAAGRGGGGAVILPWLLTLLLVVLPTALVARRALSPLARAVVQSQALLLSLLLVAGAATWVQVALALPTWAPAVGAPLMWLALGWGARQPQRMTIARVLAAMAILGGLGLAILGIQADPTLSWIGPRPGALVDPRAWAEGATAALLCTPLALGLQGGARWPRRRPAWRQDLVVVGASAALAALGLVAGGLLLDAASTAGGDPWETAIRAARLAPTSTVGMAIGGAGLLAYAVLQPREGQPEGKLDLRLPLGALALLLLGWTGQLAPAIEGRETVGAALGWSLGRAALGIGPLIAFGALALGAPRALPRELTESSDRLRSLAGQLLRKGLPLGLLLVLAIRLWSLGALPLSPLPVVEQPALFAGVLDVLGLSGYLVILVAMASAMFWREEGR